MFTSFTNRNILFDFLTTQISKSDQAAAEPLTSLPITIKNKIDFKPSTPVSIEVAISLKEVKEFTRDSRVKIRSSTLLTV
jgi:hypothetical protein